MSIAQHSFISRALGVRAVALLLLGLLIAPVAGARPAARRAALLAEDARDREIASLFAPVFFQGLGDEPRYDYITNFDFDNDWRGDNNWENAADPRFRLRAYIYYGVSEPTTHYFIHYAVFHPRDYKGGMVRGRILSSAMRRGANWLGRFDPTGRVEEAVLAHENDLEGCLIVAEKNGADPARARVAYVETLAHNRFQRFLPAASPDRRRDEEVTVEGQRAHLYAEPRGHGIKAYRGEHSQRGAAREILIYRFTGVADDPEERSGAAMGYELVPLATTLWARAQEGENETYGETHDYGTITISVRTSDGRTRQHRAPVGRIGSVFRGTTGGSNMARAPWGWFDTRERSRPLGDWFFQPAETVKRQFRLGERFSTTYVYQPFLGVSR